MKSLLRSVVGEFGKNAEFPDCMIPEKYWDHYMMARRNPHLARLDIELKMPLLSTRVMLLLLVQPSK